MGGSVGEGWTPDHHHCHHHHQHQQQQHHHHHCLPESVSLEWVALLEKVGLRMIETSVGVQFHHAAPLGPVLLVRLLQKMHISNLFIL